MKMKMKTEMGTIRYRDSIVYLDFDHDWASYYRWLIKKHVGIYVEDNRLWVPGSGTKPIHATVAKISNSDSVPEWGKYEGKRVRIYHDGMVNTHLSAEGRIHTDKPYHFWFIEFDSSVLDKIRNSLGLETEYRYHVTIGRTTYTKTNIISHYYDVEKTIKEKLNF